MDTLRPENQISEESRKLFSLPAFSAVLLERLASGGVLVVNTEMAIIYASSRAAAVLGISVPELVGSEYFDIVNITNERGLEPELASRPEWGSLHDASFVQITPYFCMYAPQSSPAVQIAIKTTPFVHEGVLRAAVVEIREVQRKLKTEEMKMLFVSFAAHQLKTPSSVVKGFLELLLREGANAFSKQQWEHMESAYEANEKLIGLSKSLLNLTKLEGGLIEPKITPFNPHEILHAKIETHQALALPNEVIIHYNQQTTIDSFHADPFFFAEIFEIILSNAIKFSPSKSRIVVALSGDDREISVSVTDQGPGIDQTQQTSLFKTIAQADESNNSHGLGLLIARKYLDLLGGTIKVSSRVGEGSTFIFTIPRPL